MLRMPYIVMSVIVLIVAAAIVGDRLGVTAVAAQVPNSPTFNTLQVQTSARVAQPSATLGKTPLQITALTTISQPGYEIALSAQSAPRQACKLEYAGKATDGSTLAGASDGLTDAAGRVSFRYLIDRRAAAGTASLSVTCSDSKIALPVTIT
jgi:hypothetical protein